MTGSSAELSVEGKTNRPELTGFRNNDHPCRILALGDSYTIGEGVSHADSWPGQLVTCLRKKGWIVDDPLILARTGWTTDELLEAIAREHLEGPFDIVSLLIGVNNQYRGRSTEEYRVEFKTLANLAVRLARNRTSNTIVLSVPDWGVTPFAEGKNRVEIGAEIDRFNDVNRKESQALGVRYIDVTPSSRDAAADPELVAGDGLHPSGKMYSTWVNLILQNVLENS